MLPSGHTVREGRLYAGLFRYPEEHGVFPFLLHPCSRKVRIQPVPAKLLPLPPKKEEPLEAGPASFAGLTAGAQQAAAQKAPPKSSFGAYAGALGGLRRESQPVNFYRPPKYPFTIFKIVGPFPPCIADLYAVLRPDILFFRSSPSEIRRGDLVLVTDTRASIPVPAQYFDFRGGAKKLFEDLFGKGLLRPAPGAGRA